MTGKIFINYRRGDDAGFTQALYQRLEDEFTAGDLFMDVEGHIKPGDDFVEVLNTQVAQADVLLVVIGPRWVDLLAVRAGDPDDFVAIEIKAGLDKNKRVIPVLVGGASMPRAEAIPEVIRPLARRNAVGLRPERFRADCQGLVTALKEQLAAAESERAARTDVERAAAEAARLKREAEGAARIAAAEERARAQSFAGLSPDEIRKGEELANWDFIKERGQAQALRDHLARFPNGVTGLYALTRLEEVVWAACGDTPDIATLQAFIDEFPKGTHAEAARGRMAELQNKAARAEWFVIRGAQETAAWGAVAAGTNAAGIEAFLRNWPQGQHAVAAKARIKELKQGARSRRRWMLEGAGVTAGLVAMVAVGWSASWWGVEQWRWRASLGDVSLKVVERSAALALKPKDSLKECDTCPEMVVVPAGTFVMGSPSSEVGRFRDEGPPHRVTIAKPFAVGKTEVTFEEWDACAAAGACNRYQPGDGGWGRGKQPVIYVSWDDAHAYIAWLSAKTGQRYRLLSEAEWEYAARAGSDTTYSFGDETSLADHAWYDGNSGGRAKPVGTRKVNKFGLYDMHGNVWEWVEDCYHDSYHDSYGAAPTDGSAWKTACLDSRRRAGRGGSWISIPQDLRTAHRGWNPTDFRYNYLGFRLARTLSP